MTREEIHNKLQYGDYILIAQKTGKRSETVRSQIAGRRTLKDNVREAAIELITVREKIEQEFINRKSHTSF